MFRGSPWRLSILDAALAVLILYASVWIYELGNILILSLSGASPILQVNGWVPQGMTLLANGTDQLLGFKLLQTASVVACVASAAVGLRRSRLLFTKVALLSVGGAYLAGLQWEFLSEVPVFALTHEEVFLALTIAIGLFLVALNGKRLNLL